MHRKSFVISVLPGNRATQTYRRPDDGRSAKFRIGITEKVTLAEARAKAKALGAEVTQGFDPQQEKVDGRRHGESPTITAMAELWITTKAQEWRAATIAEKEHYVRAEITPQIGKLDPRRWDRCILRAERRSVRSKHSPA